MDYSSATDIASPPRPGGSDPPLSQETFDMLWPKDILDFDSFLDVPVSATPLGHERRPLTSLPKCIHQNTLGHLPSSFVSHSDFNAENDTLFTPAQTTSTGVMTDLIAQPNHEYPVSQQWHDRRHWLTLLCHRMTSVLGPCQFNVCPVIPFAMALHVNSTQSSHEYKFRRI